jgi:hypothetical protein
LRKLIKRVLIKRLPNQRKAQRVMRGGVSGDERDGACSTFIASGSRLVAR